MKVFVLNVSTSVFIGFRKLTHLLFIISCYYLSVLDQQVGERKAKKKNRGRRNDENMQENTKNGAKVTDDTAPGMKSVKPFENQEKEWKTGNGRKITEKYIVLKLLTTLAVEKDLIHEIPSTSFSHHI